MNHPSLFSFPAIVPWRGGARVLLFVKEQQPIRRKRGSYITSSAEAEDVGRPLFPEQPALEIY